MIEDIERIKRRIKNKRSNITDNKVDTDKTSNYLKKLLSRTLITIILVLVSVIYINSSEKNLLAYKDVVLTQNLSFAKIKNTYQKYFGEVIPIDIENEDSKAVFNEKLSYSDIRAYNDGFKLTVASSSIIKAITSGIIVYMGEKEGYGNTIIVQGIDGVDIWYGNVTNADLTLYDYIEKDSIIGEAKGDYVYFVLTKDGDFLDYEEYVQKNKN